MDRRSILLALILVPSAAAVEVEFGPGSELEGRTQMDAAWLLLIVPPGETDGWLDASAAHTWASRQDAQTTVESPGGLLNISDQRGLREYESRADPFHARISTEGWHSVLIRGQIELGFTGRAVVSDEWDETWSGRQLAPQGAVDPRIAAPDASIHWMPAGSMVTEIGVAFQGASEIHLHGINLTCSRGPCVESDAMIEADSLGPLYHRLINPDASGKMAIDRAFVLAGGHEGRVAQQGELRLVEARWNGCADCRPLAGRTLTATGNFSLANLTWTGESFRADLTGYGETRIDEEPAVFAFFKAPEDAALVVGAAAGAAILIGALISRHILSRPLRHEARSRLVEAMREQGLLGLRGMQEETGLANGQVVYHLKVLQKAGLIVSMGSEQRPLHGLAEQPDRAHRFASKDAWLREIFLLLQTSPGLTQAQMSTQLGTSRSSTQRRLQMLERLEVLHTESEGANKRYSLSRAPSQPGDLGQAGVRQHERVVAETG